MDIPEWVPPFITLNFEDPKSGYVTSVTYKIAPKSQQRTRAPEKKDIDIDAGYGERRRVFMGNVVSDLNILMPKDFGAREKTVYKPLDDILYLMWQQHKRKSVKDFDQDAFDKEWDQKLLRFLRYCPHSQIALSQIGRATKKRLEGLTAPSPIQMATTAQHIVQQRWWLKDAWSSWAALYPDQAKEISAEIARLKAE